jgi:hypothetical protein
MNADHTGTFLRLFNYFFATFLQFFKHFSTTFLKLFYYFFATFLLLFLRFYYNFFAIFYNFFATFLQLLHFFTTFFQLFYYFFATFLQHDTTQHDRRNAINRGARGPQAQAAPEATMSHDI